MKKIFGLGFAFVVLSMLALALAQNPAGLITVVSNNTIEDTQAKLETAIEAAGLRLVLVLDHAANAANADLELRPTRLVIFGNPNVGTPLMQAAQTTAIDLPQKMLLWEDENGQVNISYNDPFYLRARHQSEADLGRFSNISNALKNLANAAATP